MNRRFRLRCSHRAIRPPTAAEHDAAFVAIGCRDNVPKSRLDKLKDRDRVTKKQKRRRK